MGGEVNQGNNFLRFTCRIVILIQFFLFFVYTHLIQVPFLLIHLFTNSHSVLNLHEYLPHANAHSMEYTCTITE